ncbi:MAG: glutaredoxin family protein [Deltaproteobacteria bacterium]|nr:glutaredoxin family protein [Deltaproteobacteria bacterium]
MAKEYLSRKGIHFVDHDVTMDPEALQEMVRISGARAVPVIAACGEVMVGFDQARLDQILSCITQKTEI